MRFWRVTHSHSSCLQADSEAEAYETMADSVRENAEAKDCTAEEITEEEFDRHWRETEDNEKDIH